MFCLTPTRLHVRCKNEIFQMISSWGWTVKRESGSCRAHLDVQFGSSEKDLQRLYQMNVILAAS